LAAAVRPHNHQQDQAGLTIGGVSVVETFAGGSAFDASIAKSCRGFRGGCGCTFPATSGAGFGNTVQIIHIYRSATIACGLCQCFASVQSAGIVVGSHIPIRRIGSCSLSSFPRCRAAETAPRRLDCRSVTRPAQAEDQRFRLGGRSFRFCHGRCPPRPREAGRGIAAWRSSKNSSRRFGTGKSVRPVAFTVAALSRWGGL